VHGRLQQQEQLMSKNRGNKESKKPKKPPPVPNAALPGGLPAVAAPPVRFKKK